MQSIKLKKNILITGGDSRFCIYLKKSLIGKNIFFFNKKELDITNFKKIENKIKKLKIKIFIHVAALSRPMNLHNKNIDLSIKTNIIGTANVVRACKKYNVKLIYFSTNYVYPCKKGNYKETDSLFPINNYAWSKLGGECSVQMYKYSLILRLAIVDYPFKYKTAFKNIYSSYIYNRDFARILPYLLNYRGILNIGSKRKSIYNFAKNINPNIKGITIDKKNSFPEDSSLNIDRLKKILSEIKLPQKMI